MCKCGNSKENHCNLKMSCCKPITICGKHIKQTSFVINKPGVYQLKGNVSFDPIDPKSAAIVIQSDNVVLDLCKNVVAQVNTTRQTIGILIQTGHRNIKIVNGTVRDFTLSGIKVEGNTDALILGEQDSYLRVLHCGYGSTFALIDNVTNERIIQCGIQLGLTHRDENFGYGEFLGDVSNVLMTNVLCLENSPIGLHLGKINKLSALNCSFSKTLGYRRESTTSGAFNVGGVFYLGIEELGDNANDLYFQSCNFDDQLIPEDPNNLFGRLTSGCAGFFAGTAIINLEFDSCTFNRNRLEAISNAGYGTAPFWTGGVQSYIYRNCQICDNYSRYKIESHVSAFTSDAAGNEYFDPTSCMQVLNCTFARNVVQSPGFGVAPIFFGLRLVYNNSARIEGCNFSDNSALVAQGAEQSTLGTSVALSLFGAPNTFETEQQNTLVKNNLFAKNWTNSQRNGSLMAAVDVDIFTVNVDIKDNYISQNKPLTGPIGSALSTGVRIGGNKPNALVTVGNVTYVGSFTNLGLPSTWPTPSISAPGEITIPDGACATLVNNLTGKIGIINFAACGPSASGLRVLRVEAASAVATLIIAADEITSNFGGSAAQTKAAAVVKNSDGQAILAYLAQNPGAEITITTDFEESPRTGVVVEKNTIQDHATAGVWSLFGKEDTICDNIIDKCANGVYFSSTAVCNSVQGNKISNASVAGVYDEAEESSNLVVSNQVWNSADGILVDYVSGPAPVKVKSLSTGLSSADVHPLDNVVISKDVLLPRKVEIESKVFEHIEEPEIPLELQEKIAELQENPSYTPLDLHHIL